MRAELAVIGLALLGASACSRSSHEAAPTPAPPAAAPSAAVAPAPVRAPETAESPAVRYTCDDGSTLTARYAATPTGGVRLTLQGRELTLPPVESGSGAKYMATGVLAAGQTLTWWTQGDSAMLIQAPQDAPPDSGEGERLVNCESAPGAEAAPP